MTDLIEAFGDYPKGITMGWYLNPTGGKTTAKCEDGSHASGCSKPKWITSDDGDEVNLKGMCGYCRSAESTNASQIDNCSPYKNRAACIGDPQTNCDWEDVFPPSNTDKPVYVWTPETPSDSVSDMKASYKCTDNTSGYSVARIPSSYDTTTCTASQVNGATSFGAECTDPVACGSRCGCVNTTNVHGNYGYNDRNKVGLKMCNLTTQYLQSDEFKDETDTGLNKFSLWTKAGQISKKDGITPDNLDGYNVDCRFAGWSRKTHHCPWATSSKGDKHHVPECRCFIQEK
ncbi:MAG: hypothetical protein GY918_14160 [Gammaproteobacteria bacterium]|nr:hypothetical protein [Gammaproteobacteria bacterium]